MPMRAILAFTAVLLLLIGSLPARADDAAVIDQWYTALLAADRAGLAGLLSDDARIRLDDLGVEQDKAEFIASMDQWQGAVDGASIRHRIAKSDAGVTTVVACYDFPGNDLLMQETFALTDGRITASSQATIAETCEAY